MDSISTARRSENMSRIRSKDTKPEMVIRRMLHRMGYRYVLHKRDLPGVPDLVFPSRRKVILVHGCFWHHHKGCIDGRIPKSRLDYWGPKLLRNVERDLRNISKMRRRGWKVIKVWECDTTDAKGVIARLVRFLGPPEKHKNKRQSLRLS